MLNVSLPKTLLVSKVRYFPTGVPYSKKFPSLGETTRIRVPLRLTSSIELIISHLERQNRLWGDQYVDRFTREFQARLADLETVDFNSENARAITSLFSVKPALIENSSESSQHTPSVLPAITHEQAQEINVLTNETFRDLKEASGLTSRECWQLIEKSLINNTASMDEINAFYEVTHGLSQFSLRELELLRFRHRDKPLFMAAYESIQGIHDRPSFTKLRIILSSMHQLRDDVKDSTMQSE